MQVPGFFWAQDNDWVEVNQCLDYLFESYESHLTQVREHAREALRLLEPWFELFEEYCRKACPLCSAPCCREARVAYDFRDLVLLHALGLETPPHQLRRHEGEHCRYLGEKGCGLERRVRPFVCTWYLCAAILEMFREEHPRFQREYSSYMTQAQQHRNMMEEAFIQVTAQGLDQDHEAPPFITHPNWSNLYVHGQECNGRRKPGGNRGVDQSGKTRRDAVVRSYGNRVQWATRRS